jgi:hypothetical protein
MAASASLIAAVTLLTGAKAPPAKFEEIDVGRINIREPDGKLRMVISNREQFPGEPWKGGEKPRPDRRTMAGMLFINDEGTENGGLIQKGFVDADGKVNAGVSLTFDRFRVAASAPPSASMTRRTRSSWTSNNATRSCRALPPCRRQSAAPRWPSCASRACCQPTACASARRTTARPRWR